MGRSSTLTTSGSQQSQENLKKSHKGKGEVVHTNMALLLKAGREVDKAQRRGILSQPQESWTLMAMRNLALVWPGARQLE